MLQSGFASTSFDILRNSVRKLVHHTVDVSNCPTSLQGDVASFGRHDNGHGIIRGFVLLVVVHCGTTVWFKAITDAFGTKRLNTSAGMIQ